MNETNKNFITGGFSASVQLGVILIGLCLANFYSHTLFYVLSEFFSIIIAFAIAIVAWNSRRFIDNNYYLLIGIGYFFISIFDIFNVLSGPSMHILSNVNNFNSELGLIGSLLASISFLIAPIFIKRKINTSLAMYSYFSILIILFYLIFSNKIEISTQNFLIYRIIISFILCLAIFLLHKHKESFDKRVFTFILLSMTATIFSQLFFIFDKNDVTSHLFKVASFYLIYLGIIETILIRPFWILFKNLKDNEVALRESEERYRSIVELSPDALIVHNGGMIEFINTAGVKLLGAQSEEDVIGKKFIDFFHEDYHEFISSRINQINNGKDVSFRDSKIVTLDGRTIEVEIKGVPIVYRGKPAVQAIFRDITNRKLAIDDASDHVVVTNPEGKIIYANKAAERMTGFKREEMIGKTSSLWGNCIEKSHNPNISFCTRAWDMITETNTSFIGEVVNQRKNGEKYIADLHISPVYEEDEIIFYIAIERDITRLKEIDRAKTEFVSLASHQLRTPLTSISLSTELLLRGIAGNVEPDQKKYLEEIFSSSLKMKELIDSLLNITRIELGTFVIKSEPMSIEDEVNHILEVLKLQIKDKKIKLAKRVEKNLPIIIFDRNILNIIIENLLTNSIRYTPLGGRIFLNINKKGQELLISVSDTGCGIPKEQQKNIFNKSFRAENAKEICIDGAGLGLYTAKSLAKVTGSKIWFDSEEGKGSTFYLSIPLKNE